MYITWSITGNSVQTERYIQIARNILKTQSRRDERVTQSVLGHTAVQPQQRPQGSSQSVTQHCYLPHSNSYELSYTALLCYNRATDPRLQVRQGVLPDYRQRNTNLFQIGAQLTSYRMEPDFSSTNHIFETKEPFREGFTPEEILEREDVIRQYTQSLQDVADGFGPPNVFVYGDSGLGKTAITTKMMETLQQQVAGTGVDLTVIKINCNTTDTTYGVVRKLASELHPDSDFKQGHHHERLWEETYSQMDRIGGDFLLILDEVDQLGDDDTLLYEFPRARSMGKIENARVGVIGISNDYLYRESLRNRVKSTLCEDEIQFNPYGAAELEAILGYYADIAFKPNVVDSSALALCAGLTASETGDARHALDLLKTAGNTAQRNDSNSVTAAHVRKARSEVERADIEETFKSSLPLQQQLTLLATTFLHIKTQDMVRQSTVYDSYSNIASDLGYSAVTERRITSFLGKLSEKGLIETEVQNLGGRGGRWYKYSTVVEPRTIIEAVNDCDEKISRAITSDIKAELNQYEHQTGTAQSDQKQTDLGTTW